MSKKGYTVVKLYRLYIGNEFTGLTFFDRKAAIEMRDKLKRNFKINEIDLTVTLKTVYSDEI